MNRFVDLVKKLYSTDYDLTKTNGLLNVSVLDNEVFKRYYSENHKKIDSLYTNKYYSLPVNENLIHLEVGIHSDGYWAECKYNINNVLIANKYKYDKLIATLYLDYNPIWNVDGTVTTERNGNDESNITYGKVTSEELGGRNDSSLKGEETEKTDYGKATSYINGERTDTDNRGSEVTSVNYGSQHGETKNYVVPYDEGTSESLHDSTEQDSISHTDETSLSSRSDSHTQGEQINNETLSGSDSTTTTARQDTFTQGEQNNKTTDSGNDTTNKSYNDNETVTRQGNIGVTSTQALIKEEREVAMFNIFDIIYEDIVDAVCLSVY